MEDESIKAALVTLGLKEDASLTDIRSAYLAKTTQNRFRQVILGDEHLEKDFSRYYKTYITLLKHHSESENTDLNDYQQDLIVKFHFNQGLFHLINQNYIKAMEKFQVAYNINKKDVLVLLYMGILLMKRKNYYAAEKYFLDAVAVDEKSEDTWFYLGENYFKAGEYRKALNMFESVRRLDPTRKELLLKIRETKEKMQQSLSPEDRKKSSLLGRIFKKG